MKKFILFLFIILLISCEPVMDLISPIVDDTPDIIYFADIEPSSTTGTTETSFEFNVNTNDLVSEWIIDGIKHSGQIRSATEITRKFSSGDHVISVVTENGAEDSVTISVSGLIPVFSVSGYNRDITTEIFLEYPIIKIDGTEYNMETDSGPYSTSTSETHMYITLSIEVDGIDSFLFVNDNAYNLHAIDLKNMNIEEFEKLIYLLYPDRYYVEPEWNMLKYSLSGGQGVSTDVITVHPEYITINGERIENDDLTAVYSDNKTYLINITYDKLDSFLFVNGNMQFFFDIDLDSMNYEEFIITADVLKRYPEENIWVLSGKEKS